jgi:RNA polymerase sigma-70 factor (ECF subfamily)
MSAGHSFIGHLPLDLYAPAVLELADVELVEECRRDQEAYAILYHRYANSVYRYMLVCVGNEQDAQDLTAQTFLAGLENINAYQGRGRFAAWLFSIARRKAMDYYRHDHNDVHLEDLVETPHPDRQPDQVAEDHFSYEELTRAIRTLAPDRAEAIRLRVFAELSVGEIGEAMERSEYAVRMLLSRAVQDLKQRLHTRTADPTRT